MRIQSLYLDGFGVFHDFRLPSGEESFSESITVVLGPNESGKSTLLSFIRAILFGFLDARSAENRYLPLNGGRYGGRVFLAGNSGDEYVLQRYAGSHGGALSLTLPDGSVGNADDLNVLLGNATRDLFRNVFAFSLGELQAFDTLEREEVKARIYSAGIGVGRLPVEDVVRRIEKDRASLFKEQGSSQEITKLFQEMDKTREELRQLSKGASDYDRLRRELDELTTEISALRDMRRSERNHLTHVTNMRQAWVHWVEYTQANGLLAELPKVEQFPSDGIVKLERLLDRQRKLGDDLSDIRTTLGKKEAELALIQVDDGLLGAALQIDASHRGLDKYESARKDLPINQHELTSKLRDLEGTLSEIGPGWEQDRARAFDTSFAARETIRRQRDSLRAAHQTLHESELETNRVSAQLEEANKDRERLGKAWKGLGEHREDGRANLPVRRQLAQALLRGLARHRDSLAKKEHVGQRRTDWESRRISNPNFQGFGGKIGTKAG